jgi:hypothetical protein
MLEVPSAPNQSLALLFAGDIEALQFVEWAADPSKLGPILLELACGHRVMLAVKYCTMVETVEPVISSPWSYWAIRVYVAGDFFDDRMRIHSEFREGVEFERQRLGDIWEWLEGLAASRTIYEFDYVDEIMEVIDDYLAFNFSLEDACQHFQRLPGLCIPSLFDRWDDSLSNDQND